MAETMLEMINVSKRFGSILALDEVSFKVQSGEIVGLLGPNSGGKTTIMRILACFFPPTNGAARVAGIDVERDSLSIRRKIGYFLEKASSYPNLRVSEFLWFVAGMKGVPRSFRRKAISEVVVACNLDNVVSRIIGNLSKGYRQRVGLAQALLNDPEVLLLDEPTIGLDPEQVSEIRGFIKGLRGRKTVLLSTHILSEVSQLCDKIIIIDKGRIVAVDTAEKLSAHLEESAAIFVQIEASNGDILEELKKIQGIVRIEKERTVSPEVSNYLIKAGKGFDIPRELCALAFKNQWILREMRSVKLSLEDIFLRLVAKERQGS